MNKLFFRTAAARTEAGQLTRLAAFTKRVRGMAVLLMLATATLTTITARAEDGLAEVGAIVASWRVTVNVTNPSDFPSFPVLMTFHADGTMLQSRLSYIPAFGVIETTAHGAWKRIDGSHIAATSFALAQGAPGNTVLNGAFFGTEKVDFQPVIAADGNSFTAPWTSIVYDPNGNPIIMGGGNLSGVRVQVDH